MVDDVKKVDDPELDQEVELDPEDQELKDAEAALKAEQEGSEEIEAGGKSEEELKGELEGKPDTSETQKPVEGKNDKPAEEQKMVPLAALIDERHKNQQLREQNAYIMGVAEANKANNNPDNPAPEPELTPEQKLQAIYDERIALAEKHDDADISSADWERQKIELGKQEDEIRREMAQPAPETQPVPQQDLGLEQHLANLEQRYEGLGTLSERQAEHLKGLVMDQAAMSGNPILPGAAGTARLREEIAGLATRVFPDQIKLVAAEPEPDTGKTPAEQGLSKQAKDRDAAINKAQGMPPDLSNTGSRDDGQPLSEAEIMAKIEGMTDEEQAEFLNLNPRFLQQVIGSDHL